MSASQQDPPSFARPSMTLIRPGAHRGDLMSWRTVCPVVHGGHFEEHTSFAVRKQVWHSGCRSKCCVHWSYGGL